MLLKSLLDMKVVKFRNPSPQLAIALTLALSEASPSLVLMVLALVMSKQKIFFSVPELLIIGSALN